MDRKFGAYIVAGLVIGEALGLLWGTAIDNAALGIGLGALGGVFVGWFAAAAAIQKSKENKEDK